MATLAFTTLVFVVSVQDALFDQRNRTATSRSLWESYCNDLSITYADRNIRVATPECQAALQVITSNTFKVVAYKTLSNIPLFRFILFLVMNDPEATHNKSDHYASLFLLSRLSDWFTTTNIVLSIALVLAVTYMIIKLQSVCRNITAGSKNK